MWPRQQLAHGLHGEFTVDQARLAGLSWRQLQGAAFRRTRFGRYRLSLRPDDSVGLLRAIAAWLPEGAVFSGRTAAWLLGLSLPGVEPAEVTVPDASWVRPRPGLAVVRAHVAAHEIDSKAEFRITTLTRTLTDLGRRASIADAVVAIDEALHRSMITRRQLDLASRALSGAKGVGRMRRALELCNSAAESPMETRLRLLIVLAGLPCPAVQVEITHHGQFIARPDLLYVEERLVIEFDGGTHRERMVDDNRRQNRLVSAGYSVLRFTSADIHHRSAAVVAEIERIRRHNRRFGPDQSAHSAAG
jgi:hypothetical protein